MGTAFQFGENENVLEMDGVMIARHCDCTRYHRTRHLKMAKLSNFVVFYYSKKKLAQECLSEEIILKLRPEG